MLSGFGRAALKPDSIMRSKDVLLMLLRVDTWRKLSIWVAIPALIISGVNAWRLWNEHWEHQAHLPPVEERTEYPFMNIRNKAFPWGDGDKVRILDYLTCPVYNDLLICLAV
jgi:hypothetical protein